MYASVPPHAYAETWRHREYLHTRWQAGAFRPVRNFDPYGSRRTVAPRPKRTTAQIAITVVPTARTATRSHHASAFAFLPVLSMVEK